MTDNETGRCSAEFGQWEASQVLGPASSDNKRSSKMPLLSKSIATVAMTVVAGLSLSGCATEDYVDKHIAVVNDRVSALEARVAQVDQTAQAANAAAQAAGGAAQQANQRIDQLTSRVDMIEQQMARKKPRN
jgi:outer membrane murein-binding lipoprotein Lpp